MATNFPATLDSFPNPGPNLPMNTPGLLEHDIQHSNENDAIEAIQGYVGVTGSGDVNSITNKLATVTSAQAATAVTVAAIAASQTIDEANIAALLSSNPAGPAQGQVYIAPTATLGTAIANAYASFGSTPGVIQLGKGTFTLDVAVALRNNMTIRGMGRNSTFIVFDPSTIPVAFTANPTAVNTVRLDGFRIQTTAGGVGTGTALDLGYVNYAVVTNFSTGASGAYPNKGIDFSINNNTNSPYYSVVRDSLIQVSGASPIGIDISNQANSNVIDNVRVDAPGTNTGTPIGVKIGGSVRASHTILLNHCDFESVSTMTGVWITNSSYNVTLNDCYFEAVALPIQIDAGSQNIKAIGCYLYNWSTAAFTDSSAGGGVQIEGMATVAAGAGTAFPLNYRSTPQPIVFTSSGSLARNQTYGAQALRVRCIGGGGGGAGGAATTANASAGGGGQAGAYAEGVIPIASITFPVSVTIGTAGTATSGAAGGNGGTTSFGTLISVSGGTGGALMTAGTAVTVANGGFGGATISGAFAQITGTGDEGGSGIRYSGTQAFAGYGAGSQLGGGIIPSGGNPLTSSAGRSSGVAGSGGSGGYSIGTLGATAGGAGNTGIVIVELLY